MSANESAEARDRKSRRGFLSRGVGLVSGVTAAQLVPGHVEAQQTGVNAGMAQILRTAHANSRPIVLRDGIVLSMDRQVGDFMRGDVLLKGQKILSVGPKLAAPANAVMVNAAGMIVMPGFVDTHHHQYETVLRGLLADGMFGREFDRLPQRHYLSVIQQVFTPLYTPDDARLAELIASLSQISNGVTTTVDTSQVQLTPEHTDACIAGLKESGRRCLFAYGPGGQNATEKLAPELTRLRKQYFSSDDQLLTLAQNSAMDTELWKVGRSVGATIVSHCQGGNFNEPSVVASKAMGPDNEYIHCTRIAKDTFKAIADTGGKVSIAAAIEMQMGHAHPPIQECLDLGIRPSLSVDVECNMTADSFTQMRTAFCYQRALVNERIIQGEQNPPALLTCRDVIEFATYQGARCAHLDSKIGTLTPGKEADIIMLATNRINVAPLTNVPGAIVTLMDTSNVENVLIAGRIMKWQGRLVGVDVNKVISDVTKSLERLLARSGYVNNPFETCCPGPLLDGQQRSTLSLDTIKRGR